MGVGAKQSVEVQQRRPIRPGPPTTRVSAKPALFASRVREQCGLGPEQGRPGRHGIGRGPLGLDAAVFISFIEEHPRDYLPTT